MYASRRLSAGVATLALAVVVAIPVAAQDEGSATEADVLAPAAVHGGATPVRANQTPTTTQHERPLTATTENYGWTVLVETNDPRLSGEFETNQNAHDYVSGVTFRSGVGRLTNEAGSWAAEFHGFTPMGGNNYLIYFTGEGGYEGLYALLWMEPGGPYWEVTGVIAPGPLPEPPDWVLPPEG